MKMGMTDKEYKEYLIMLDEIEKEVDSWPKWKFLGCDCLLHTKNKNDED